MSLYRLNESSYSLLESIDLLLDEAYEDDLIDYHKSRVEELEKKLSYTELQIKKSEEALKAAIDSKPRSWLERKLVGFKAKIRKFEIKYKLTNSNKSKGIIKKILSILTRIVKFINDKLIKFTRYVYNKFDKRSEAKKGYDRTRRLINIRTAKTDNEMNKTMSNDYKDLIDDHKNEIERLKAKYKSE